jgi:hypothetical protein
MTALRNVRKSGAKWPSEAFPKLHGGAHGSEPRRTKMHCERDFVVVSRLRDFDNILSE